MRYFFHGSYNSMKIGEHLLGGRNGYQAQWSTLGRAYDLLDIITKEKNMLTHAESVFMCSENTGEWNNNSYGLDDIDNCGGATDYIFRVEPKGKVTKHDMNWMSRATMLADELEEEGINLLSLPRDSKISNYQELLLCIHNYLNEVPSEEPLWEYLTKKAEIVEVYDDYEGMEFFPPEVNFMSEYTMCKYLENDDFMRNQRGLKYVYPYQGEPIHDQEEKYLCTFSDKKIEGTEFNMMSGVLVMGMNSNGENVLYGVSVDEKYRNQGIAKKLCDAFFLYSAQRGLPIQISSFTDDGEKYLADYINKKSNSYPELFIVEKMKKDLTF